MFHHWSVLQLSSVHWQMIASWQFHSTDWSAAGRWQVRAGGARWGPYGGDAWPRLVVLPSHGARRSSEPHTKTERCRRADSLSVERHSCSCTPVQYYIDSLSHRRPGSHAHCTGLAIIVPAISPTCDETWTLRVSSVNWKHFYAGVSQPRRIVTVCIFLRLKNTLTYLLTYLITHNMNGLR